MKKIAYTLAALAAVMAFSCGSDDNNNNGNNTAVYLPLDNGNYWVYDTNTQGVDGTVDTSGRDSLYVANDTVIGAYTYKKFKTPAAATGFYTGSLSGNGIRLSGSKLLVTGSTSIAVSEDLPLNISIQDFAIFDADATAGTQIGSTSGSFQQTIQGLPLTFTYTLKTTAGNNAASLTVNGETYTNIKTVLTTLTLEINIATLGLPILEEQDVVASNQYFAEGVGVVKTSTDITYNLANFSSLGITLPIPQSGSAHQDELLDIYNVD